MRTTRHPLASRKHRATHLRAALLESLEPRTLLTVLIATGGKSASFTDIDGDHVTVTVSKGTLTTGLFITAASGQGEQLQELDLPGPTFAGANVTIAVTQAGGGDGKTNVGYINANANSLGKVVVAGDLGRIDAGFAKKGITSLTVNSMGAQGTSSQQAGGSLVSTIDALGSLNVTTDVNQVQIKVIFNIGSVNVGGSLIGGTVINSGSIQSISGNIGNVFVGGSLSAMTGISAASANSAASIKAPNGSIGNVTVNGSLIGGSAQDSAEIAAHTKMGKVIIGGSLIGGSGDFSAEIEANSIASINITGSLNGGAGESSGALLPNTLGNTVLGGSIVGGAGIGSGSINPVAMKDISVGGSIIGGAGFDSGSIFCNGGNIGKVTVTQNLTGGNSTSSSDFYTGYIEATGKIASVFIGGDVTAGNNTGGGTLLSGSIRAGTTIGSVQINGSLLGTSTLNAVISAGSKISTILIGQSVNQAQILAGYTTSSNAADTSPTNGAGQLGKLTVSGNWTASSVMAGTEVGTDTLPGTPDDTSIPGKGAGKGSIGSITIVGQVAGSVASGDHFGFISNKITAFTSNGTKALLTKNKDNLLLAGTNDVNILEI